MTTNESKLDFFEKSFLIGEIAGIIGTIALFIINMLGRKFEWNTFGTSAGACIVFFIIIVTVNRIAKHFLFRNKKQKLNEIKL